ncbi:hypothetical protein SHI21_10550 [Bacteriovorax sp. PP10]|uniref:Lipoprotein n=1 Tax=Bacteriovorax antarcticus TaxID=3088717 RepID=A0ABU5VW90_9BACT|nr:hypothetical protein [Bacteriovorax sp. PP10]MEA9356648.1 hypothetical protein [Bacteriovorax sp. PP10]
MKSILKLSALAILLTVTSCAHHGKCHDDKSQCSMKDGKKECCSDKGQCAMKKDESKETKTEEVKK